MRSSRSRVLMLIALLVAGSCSTPDKRPKMEAFQLMSLDGVQLPLDSLKGKTVFINVWATWCRPCVQEMPTIAAAMKTLMDREDIVFLFASSEPVEDITAFRDSRPFPFEYVQLQNLEELRIEAIPATFIFDPSGTLIFGEEGYRDWSTTDNLGLITQKESR